MKSVFKRHERLFINGENTELGDPEFLFYIAILTREEQTKVDVYRQFKEIKHPFPVSFSFRNLQI